MTRKAMFEIGYVAHAHGLQGELELHTHDAESQVLGQVKRIWLERSTERGEALSQEFKVAGSRHAARGWLMRLAGVNTREAAEALRRSTVSVFRDDLPDLEEDGSDTEFYQGDLVGLEAVDEQGQRVGRVEEIWNHGPVPTLVIRSEAGVETLLPFADDFVQAVEPEQGRIIVKLPEYVG